MVSAQIMELGVNLKGGGDTVLEFELEFEVELVLEVGGCWV